VCTDLPAPGVWQRIDPPDTHFSGAMAIDPHQPGGLWTGMADHGMYRSDDCGKSWRSVNGKAGFAVGGAGVASIAVDPVDRGVLYVAYYLGPLSIWKSTNGGADWVDMFPGNHPVRAATQYNWFQSVRLDPSDHRHIVASTHGPCFAPYNDACQMESTDAGASWKIVRNPQGSGWAENGGAIALGPNTWLFGAPFGPIAGLWLSTDHGDSWTQVNPPGTGGPGGLFSIRPVPASDGYVYLPTHSGMVRSKDGLAWEALPNLTGRFVGMVTLGDHFIVADQWTPTYRVGNVHDLGQWTTLPAPPTLKDDEGSPFLDYDATHRVLYSSTWSGGLWRMVLPATVSPSTSSRGPR
jgi:hypothetical protein